MTEHNAPLVIRNTHPPLVHLLVDAINRRWPAFHDRRRSGRCDEAEFPPGGKWPHRRVWVAMI